MKNDKKDLYRRIKFAGFLSFIPFVLVGGPLAGYIAGDYLQKRFGFPLFSMYIFIAVGFLASAAETIRIIRLLVSMEKKPDG